VDVSVTTGQGNEGKQLIKQVERIEATLGEHVACVTCDAGYAHGVNYEALEARGTDAIIPPPPTQRRTYERIPMRRFKYDAYQNRITCPNGKHLAAKGHCSKTNGRFYRARACDCQACPQRERCFSQTAKARQILLGEGYIALLRARRRKEKGWNKSTLEKYTRHRWQVEGVHGRSKTQHGLSRAIGRGLTNVTIQSYLTAAVMNLKKLAKKHPATKDQYRLTQACTRLTTQFYALWTSIRQHHKINTPKGYAPPPKQLFTN